jgi:acetyl esterase/lipase
MMNTHAFNLKFTPLLALLSLLLASPATRAADAPPPSDPIPLWPGDAPGEKGDISAETSKETGGITRISNVTTPSIQIYRPAPDKDTGAAVLVCPGGGYNILAIDHEGTKMCAWLNSVGVTGVLLKYRVPRRTNLEKHVAPLQDVQRAMGIVRHRAKEWNIDPARIGVMGFSAGGHLCATLSTNFDERTYPSVDDADRESCRPDFAILIYPFYLTLDGEPSKLAPEIRVSEKTPPTFMVMTQDDRVEYAYAYALALKKAKVPAELHIYATAGHGFGLGTNKGPVSTWTKRAEEWLAASGWLTKH